MKTDLISTLIGLGILLIIIILTLVGKRKKQDENTKNDANDFLDGIFSSIKRVILDTLSDISLASFKDKISREAFIAAVLKEIYEEVWKFVKDTVTNKDNKTGLEEATQVLLENKDFVDTYVDKVADKINLEAKILEKYDNEIELVAEEESEEQEKEDKELQEEFSDNTYNEEIKDDELDDLLESIDDKDEPTEEQLSQLNPQTDESSEPDPENDSSVEVLDDDIYYDKGGRPRSRSTGKWVKVNK